MNISNETCFELTGRQYEDLALARGLTGMACFIPSLVILFIMIAGMYRSKFSRGLLEWIVIYLSALTMVDDALFAILMLPSLADWEGFCRALGIGLELVNWVQLGCTFVIALHQLYLLYKLVSRMTHGYARLKDEQEQTERQAKMIKKCHYCALLLIWLPILLAIVWLPFESETEYKEIESEWCWIVSITDDCEKDGLEFAEELIVWYIPVLVVCCTVAVTTLATLGVWMYTSFKKHYHGENVVEKYRPNNLITVITFGLFTVVCLVELVVRSYTIIYRKHNFVMWMIFSVATPFRDVMLPAGYTVQVWLYRRHNKKEHAGIIQAEYEVDTSSNLAHFQPSD